MGIYIYKENSNTGLVVLNEALKPAANRNFKTVNGVAIPAERQAYKLLDTVTEINTAFNFANKDYKTIRDALKTKVDEVGFENLSAQEQYIAAWNNIGTGAQMAAAITNNAERDEASYQYLTTMKTVVRPKRSRQLESLVWSRCKSININVSGQDIPMPEVIYSQITIDNPIAANGELGGNLLDYYERAGIGGFTSGDSILGVLDYLYSTIGTRFAGTGFVESFAGVQPLGYADIAAFRDALAAIIVVGCVDTVTT